jgi:hypothetical protein
VAAGTYGINCALSTLVSTPGDRRDTVLRGNCDVLVTDARQIERCDVSRPAAFGRGFFTPHTGFARERRHARDTATRPCSAASTRVFESGRDAARSAQRGLQSMQSLSLNRLLVGYCTILHRVFFDNSHACMSSRVDCNTALYMELRCRTHQSIFRVV